jgi:hypothetical protein
LIRSHSFEHGRQISIPQKLARCLRGRLGSSVGHQIVPRVVSNWRETALGRDLPVRSVTKTSRPPAPGAVQRRWAGQPLQRHLTHSYNGAGEHGVPAKRAARLCPWRRASHLMPKRQGMARPRFDCTKFRGHWPLTSCPPFITNRTFSSTLTSATGSPSTATMSANFPGSSVPTRSLQPIRSAAFTVAA